MNREDIDILEVGNAYTALFYKKNHYQPYIVAWHLTRIPTHGIRVIIFVT